MRRTIIAALFVAIIAPALAADPEKIADSALAQIRALEQEKLSRSALHRKLDSQFVFKLRQNRNQAIAPGVTKLRPDIEFQADGRILVDIEAKVTDALLAQIRQSGGTVLNSFPQFRAIRALVSLEQLENLAVLADVKTIRRASRAHTNTGSVTSEGDVTHQAALTRSTFGVNGQGIRVGVLSDSIAYLANSQASGDLGDVTILPGQNGQGSGEGTAMLEIVHDLAPGAQLYFATAYDGEASFAQNILNLRSNGCDVIVDDVYYFDESPFQDGIIAQAINRVTASGALYFSAAGNDGNVKDNTSGTWEGDFADAGPALQPVNAGGGTIHSFGPVAFNTVVSPGYGVDLFWADPLGASTNDYDLFVLDSTGTNVVASSLNAQDGTQDPYESISYLYTGERIVIVRSSGAGRFLHLSTSRGLLSLNTGGATKGHSAAAAALGVAAVNAATAYPNPFSGGGANPVERFSSDGPRRVFFQPDGTPITAGNFSSTGGTLLQKPDLAAADGVMTSLYYFTPFFGTSAAAPHAAAIAALLWSYDHNFSANQIRTALTNSALNIEAPGLDSNSGAGIVMAYPGLLALPAEPHIVAGTATFLAENCPDGSLDPGERVTVALSLTNTGVANATNLVAVLLASGGVTSPSGPQTYGFLAASGGTTNRPFAFTASGLCGDTNIATLQLQDGTNVLGTVSFAFRLGKQRVILSENFDNVTPPALPAGWTSSSSGAGAPWRTINTAYDSPPNAVFVPDPSSFSDKTLTSPGLPISTASAQLAFRHSYYTEFCCDHGILEISIGGGTFTEIIAAGGSFVRGGYNGFGWAGYSGGFITTVANLPPAAAGQNVKLRWHFTSDYSGGYDGWYIDSISLLDGFDCCVPAQNDLAVGISASPDPVVLGGNVTYTINVVNTGPTPATEVTMVDVLPPSVTFQSASVSQGSLPPGHGTSGGSISLNLGTLPGGGITTITIVGATTSLGLITNRVSVTRGEPDANPTNNVATAVTAVILPGLSINPTSVLEGNSRQTNHAVFSVTLWPPPGQAATVNFATSNLTALAGSDYVPTTGLLVFGPGVTNQSISVPIIGDDISEPDETFAVVLSTPTNAVLGRSQALCTIINDDPLPKLSVSDVTVAESDSGTTNAVFTVHLSAPSGQTVYVTASTSDGTALGSSDYVPLYNTQMTFNPGESNHTVTVVVNSHVTLKPSQTFYLNLYGAFNAKIGRELAQCTILTALPGQIDHLLWGAASSPQAVGGPFGVSITAQDFFNGPATNFSGTVALSGSGSGGTRTNTIFGNVSHTDFYNYGTFTIANAFTPNADIVVTHVRHYSGTKVSIWTDAGVLLASQNVASVPGTWVETPLATPVQLSAGQRYRVGFYTAGLNYYGRFDQSSAFTDGIVNQTYFTVGDGFPSNFDNWRWIFVDIKYTVRTALPVSISPANTGSFTNGAWSGGLTVQQPGTNVILRADDSHGHGGSSNPFDVVPVAGQVTHFTWSAIPSPQSSAAPFAVTVTAQDYFNSTATNFTGAVALNGLAGGARTNTIFGNVGSLSSGSGDYTVGYAFTPKTNMLVTHFRHYAGTKVSLWSNAGLVLASQNVVSTPGTWVETPLTKPVQLLAGQSYRLAFYSGGGTFYGRTDQASSFADVTINQAYYAYGDAFPNNFDGWRWIFVDIRYSIGAPTSSPVSPALSSNFTNGMWNGTVAVQRPATNIVLRADDGNGHAGSSNPFNVTPSIGAIDHFAWNTIASPQSALAPFAVTVTAQDYFNSAATNFTGPVGLSGTGITSARTNTIFSDIGYQNYGSGDYTVGYAFTPKTNMLVTHFRHYAGTKVSIWTDAGTLLASRNVTSLPGTWVETALTTPVQLLAGQTYRLAFYTAGSTYYGRVDQPSDFADVTINHEYYASGNAFPAFDDSGWRWMLVDIRYKVSLVASVSLSSTNTGNFTNGIWSGNITVSSPASNVVLRADDGVGDASASNPFDVAPARGLLDHFGWNAIASPQAAGSPFAVALAAQDFYNSTISNFTGAVSLSGSMGGGLATNNILGSLINSYSGSGAVTLGYSFTPNTNLTVTHVRHYSGTKVSIWTSDGTLLASQNVNSVPGTWVETPLATPVQLLAGISYRVGFYSANQNYYWRYDLPGVFPYGTINQSYETSGDAFPAATDSARWWFVDLRYTVGSFTAAQISPTNTGNFTNGLWSGNVTVQSPVSNIVMRADDGTGHTGLSNPFDVAPARGLLDHFTWSAIASPQAAGSPFAITLAAQDYYNSAISNFTGAVALNGLAGRARTNTIFGNISYTSFGSGYYTLGYAFTPNTNMLVTHFRHYAGTKVSLWSDAGLLLASQNVVSTPGTWVETLLTTPVQLSAGQRYRLAFYSGGGSYYGRNDQASSFADVTINQEYYASGDAFPAYNDNWQWILVDIRYKLSSVAPVSLTPTNTGDFTNGLWSGNVTVQNPATNIVMRADDGSGHAGSSNPFDVAPARGLLDHFSWSAIASPQAAGSPFAVTLAAQDYYNSTISNFTGAVALNGLAGRARTNTIFGNISYTSFGSGDYTLGYAFTPNTNMLVTHFRHYAGTKVSLWSDAGLLLASQNVVSTPGTWVETPLTTPVQLSAGQRYRLAFYSGGGSYYGRNDQASSFADVSINQEYYASGDAFPAFNDGWQWILVDIRYSVGTATAVSLSPTNTGNFTNGLWSGNVTASSPASNVVLRADDGNGHVGLSNPFDVAPARGLLDHFTWSAIASPQAAGSPFAVTLAALDYYNSTISNFTGAVSLSGSMGGGLATNNILGSPTFANSSSGAFTLGYSFTPSTNLTVTHVRHYSGTKVSIWASDGTLLASQTVNSVPGTWVETPLTTPVQLLAGISYRVAFYSASQIYYWRNDLPGVFPYGTIDQSYEISGDAFPTVTDSFRWWFVDLLYTVGSFTAAQISPTNTGNFVNGIWNGSITVQQPGTNLVLRADDGSGHAGSSNPLVVGPARGQTDHFVWNTIPSPQSALSPFAVTLAAQDYYNSMVTNFTGSVALSGTASGGARTNTIFGNISYTQTGSGTFTVGYAFTPNTNMLVTHFRHYAGTKVSIWTDAGTFLASKNVTSVPGAWVETALNTPVQLLAGQKYRLAFYTAGSTFYGRFDQPSAFADVTINQEYYASGDTFPANNDSWQWILVDIRYSVGSITAVSLTPTNTGNFTNGLWSGSVTVQNPMSNIVMRADDGNGHAALSNPFNVAPARGLLDHFVWSPIASPQLSGRPFPVTLAAQDYYNSAATNFTGAVALSGSIGGGPTTNNILGSPSFANSSSGAFTLGYSFTPNTNLTVTHVRHYSGTKVSIWTGGGTLLTSQTVNSVPGTWMETPLAAPVQLLAGNSYRVGFYSANQSYYWRYDLPGVFPYGTIDQSYETAGDAFPTANDSVRWWFVDLLYTVGSDTAAQISPTNSGNFVNGVWNGSITVQLPGTNLVLRADDGRGHAGRSNPFDAGALSDLPTLLTQPQGRTVLYGGNVSFAPSFAGAAPLSFQWQKNEADLTGANASSLMLPTVTRLNEGNYRLTITNLFGSARSSNAFLRVLVPQQISRITREAGGLSQLWFTDASGSGLAGTSNIEVQATTQLFNTNTVWIRLTNGSVILTNGLLRFEDLDATNYPRRFYRIIERP